MTEAEYLVLDTYVAETVRTMGLPDWKIIVSRDPAHESAKATCNWTEGRKHATLRFAPEFRTYEGLEQRNIVAHELFHCTFANAWDVVESDLKGDALSGTTYSTFSKSFYRQMEYGIDSAGLAIAQFLPPIPWPVEAAPDATPDPTQNISTNP